MMVISFTDDDDDNYRYSKMNIDKQTILSNTEGKLLIN